MPHSMNAKKRLRQNIKRRARNRSVKSSVRTSLRKAREMVAAGKASDVQASVPALAKQLDQAAAKGMIHKNKASRLKSRIAHMLVKAKA